MNSFKSLLMSYFIIKQKKVEQNNKYCKDSAKVDLQAVLLLEKQKFEALMKLEHYIILELFLICGVQRVGKLVNVCRTWLNPNNYININEAKIVVNRKRVVNRIEKDY